MSIIRMLTRWTAISALRGRTWADKRVFDSDNTPLSQALTLNAAAKPYIVVFTDMDNRIDLDGTDLPSADRELSLILEIGVASKVGGKTGDAEIKTPLTDEGMEMALDMVEEQALSALFGRPQSEWAELFKDLVIRVLRINGVRGASAERDRRWAARQVAIVCDVVSDIPYGVPISPTHPISKFIEIAGRHPEADMDHGAEICKALKSQPEAPKWEQMQAQIGARRLAMQAIGLAPLPSDLPVMTSPYGDDLTDKKGEAPLLREITHDDMQMEGDAGVGLIDKFKIDTDVGIVEPVEKKDKVVIEGENPP